MRRGVLATALFGLALLTGCGDGFDPQAWRAEKGNYDRDSRRSTMLPGLLETRLKAGTRRDDVLALLGEPDSVAQTRLVYYLGRSGYGVDFETLEIAFDAEGRLTSAVMKRS